MGTISHASLTGSALHEPKGVASASSGAVYVANGAGSGTWTVLATNVIPGAMMPYAGITVPPGSGWLLCYGQAISRTAYAALFAAIGTTYGNGDGVSTFNIPDLCGRVVAGKDNMGGVSNNRLTSPLDGDVLGATGGNEGTSLTAANLPPHYHDVFLNDPGHNHGWGKNGDVLSGAFGAGSPTAYTSGGYFDNTEIKTTGITVRDTSGGGGNANRTSTVGSTMTGTAHSNVQPTLIANYIIYTGV